MRAFRLSSSFLAVAVALAVAGCASSPSASRAAPAAANPAPYTAGVASVTLEGTVAAVDKASRTVTITGRDGAVLDVVASDAVRNFDQLRVGDRVELDYEEAVALELQPAGSAPVGLSTSQGASVAAPGSRPGGSMARTVSVVTEVVAVDPVAHTIALKGPRGNTQIIAVEREDLRAKLPGVSRGDLLRLSYTEAVALSIRPSP
jgi:hypothetical protein